ncbi:recombinase family protein [Microbacterium sp. VKM Ac-2923]|uniref:recombinase family protein n=1 Tax=Microbacterium sp. VKM Ac-2923 TaxID=2929476 RepID=UPI001FB28CDE|nr:recombinase family protein [Microbacterium sp. VKM Ac-2923]MCJ1706895.1 recombinase family protein [Microbacterium sp. VKM Ac-2923]
MKSEASGSPGRDTVMRAAIYARLSAPQVGEQSTEESDSIANQVRDLKTMAQRLGYDVVHVFADDGISGYKGKHRPGFQRLLRAIADGEVDVILSRHQDRLERNEEEGFKIRVASVKHKVTWAFASGMTMNPSTAEGGLLAKILSPISEFESHVRAQRLLMHYEGKRISGTFQAPPGTFGYERENVVEWEAQLIREAYEAIDQGRTMGSIVRQWNAAAVPQRKKGKNDWSDAHIRSILQRPRHAGLMADKDGVIIDGLVGQWEPIVDVELWQRVNHVISDPKRRSSPGIRSALVGRRTREVRDLRSIDQVEHGLRQPSRHALLDPEVLACGQVRRRTSSLSAKRAPGRAHPR